MRKLTARETTATLMCTSATLVAAALTIAGPASAGSLPSVSGQKYSDAKTALSGAGYTPVVSTTVGDRKAWSDCLVSNVVAQIVAPPQNSSGSSTNEALVSLNCYATNASNKGAGYSIQSPQGQSIAAAASSSSAAAAASSSAAPAG